MERISLRFYKERPVTGARRDQPAIRKATSPAFDEVGPNMQPKLNANDMPLLHLTLSSVDCRKAAYFTPDRFGRHAGQSAAPV
jgi:hypothetical protein